MPDVSLFFSRKIFNVTFDDTTKEYSAFIDELEPKDVLININVETYPKSFPLLIELQDSASYKINQNFKTIMLTEKSKPLTYTYNIAIPGLGTLIAGENKNLYSYLSMTTYLLFATSAISSFNDFDDYKAKYISNLNDYNATANSDNKFLALSYYAKANDSRDDFKMYAGLSLITNILSNYFLSSKHFRWR